MAGQPVLDVQDVTAPSSSASRGAIWGASFTIDPGGLAVALVEGGAASALADACVGLAKLRRGRVRFAGRDWASMSPRLAASWRGRIGRVFERGGWVNYLTVGENVTLPQIHHTRRSRAEVYEEAMKLSEEFGLPGLPISRASDMLPADLQRAACVRALMGRPRLVILERPTAVAGAAIMGPLVNALERVRQAGGAALWLTADPGIWRDAGLRPSLRLRVVGAQLVGVDG